MPSSEPLRLQIALLLLRRTYGFAVAQGTSAESLFLPVGTFRMGGLGANPGIHFFCVKSMTFTAAYPSTIIL